MAGKALSSAEATLNVLSVAGLRLKSLAETPQQVLEVLSDLNLFYSILFSCWTYAGPWKSVFFKQEAAAFLTGIYSSCWTSA